MESVHVLTVKKDTKFGLGQGDMVNGKCAGADSVKDTQWGGGGLLPKLYPCTKQHVINTVVFCN